MQAEDSEECCGSRSYVRKIKKYHAKIINKKLLQKGKVCGRITFVSGDGGMADALDSGSSGSNPVRVQVPFSALFCDMEQVQVVKKMIVWA